MKFSKKLMLLGVLLATVSLSCTKNFLDSDIERAINDNESEIVAYTQQRNLNTTKTTSGIHYVITKTNSGGKSIQLGEQAVVYYKLSLLNGSHIDSVSAVSGKPFKFGYYNGVAIFDGFIQSVSLLKEGEKGTFFIPSSLAFQNQQVDGIPAWSVIKAEIEIVEFRNEERQIDVFVADKKLKNVTITQTGLRFIPVDSTLSPNGTVLANSDIVVVKYRGTLLNDIEFDKGEFSLTLGGNTVIKGFEEGIKKMKVGEKATVIFPSSIGYGSTGSGSIPPYTPLLFELEILSKK